MKGTIFNIMRYSVNDGPGIRTTVFLKGCPLSCWWCHNPEGIHRNVEVAYRDERCIVCGDCVEQCVQHALIVEEGAVRRDGERCIVCGTCTDTCFTGARELLGREITVEDLVSAVLKDRVFYDESGGGVTFSGGEPLLQPEFLTAALEAVKAQGIHTAVETSGLGTPAHLERIRAMTDLFLYDIKLADDARHRDSTGVSNALILSNLRLLASDHAHVIVRIPVVPGFNDDDLNMRQIGDVLHGLAGIHEVHLLPFHAGASGKYRSLGMEYRLDDVHSPSAERMDEIARSFSDRGLTVHIGG